MDLSDLISLPGIGTCTSVEKIFMTGYLDRTYQVHIRDSNKYSQCLLTPSQVDIMRYLPKADEKIFCHAPFIINLSARPVNAWNVKLMTEELTLCKFMGFSGVVVHVGKSLNLKEEEAFQNMVDNLIIIESSYITLTKENKTEGHKESCPILLETPAGQGTEICYQAEDFCRVVKKARIEMKNPDNLKICVDTCHVFAAGYDPYDYIEIMDKLLPDSIALVHFNGSAGKKGCRVDRHEFEKSEITVNTLKKVYDFCMAKGIPMIKE